MRRCLKLTVVIAVVALVAAITGSSAIGQTTTTTGGSSSVPNYGPTTNGNAKAAKAVKGVPLTGTAGSGLTRGVDVEHRQGRLLPAAGSRSPARTTAYKARFERATKNKELPGGRTIDFSACQDDGSNPQTNLQIVPEARPAGRGVRDRRHLGRRAARSTDFMNPQPGAVLTAGASCRGSATTAGASASTAAWSRATTRQARRCTRPTWPSGRSRRPGLTPGPAKVALQAR